MEWKPIETAPNDATRVLVYVWDDVVSGFQQNGTWYLIQTGSYAEDGYMDGNPTHWMPWPPPPNPPA
jgi:hypothetical protein